MHKYLIYARPRQPKKELRRVARTCKRERARVCVQACIYTRYRFRRLIKGIRKVLCKINKRKTEQTSKIQNTSYIHVHVHAHVRVYSLTCTHKKCEIMREKFENKTVLCLWYTSIPIDNFNALNRLKMILKKLQKAICKQIHVQSCLFVQMRNNA